MSRVASIARATICALILALVPGAAPARSALQSVRVQVRNVVSTPGCARPGQTVTVRVADIRKAAPDFDPAAFTVSVVEHGDMRQVASQADDLDGDSEPDEIAFVLDLAPNATRDVRITWGSAADIARVSIAFPKRAHASFQTKYEGMGWESDRVAWRVYFDERNAFDMFGKLQHALLLDVFALPGVDYHAESPLGRDVYRIGDALGIGSVGAYVHGKAMKVGKVDRRSWKIIADGPVRAIADLIYKGWDVGGRKVDITSRITVWAGQHWFEHAISSPNAGDLTLVTGLPVKPAADVTFLTAAPLNPDGRGYIATWGKQVLRPGATATEALSDRVMGLALIPSGPFDRSGLESATDHLVRVPRGRNGYTFEESRWKVLSAWDAEAPDGDSVPGLDPALQLPAAVRTAQAWKRYVVEMLNRDRAPSVVGPARLVPSSGSSR